MEIRNCEETIIVILYPKLYAIAPSLLETAQKRWS